MMLSYFLRVVFAAIFLILIQAVILICVLGELVATNLASLWHLILVVNLIQSLMTLWTVILHLI